MGEIRRFREFIKQKGLRNTPEREIIIREVFSIHDHFDVDELYISLRNKKKVVSKASIYRTIPLLIESGLIKEVYFEDGHLHYEHVYGHIPHCHLRCICCGKVLEFAENEILGIQENIASKYGFLVTGHRLELSGYCSECAQKQGVRRACGLSSRWEKNVLKGIAKSA